MVQVIGSVGFGSLETSASNYLLFFVFVFESRFWMDWSLIFQACFLLCSEICSYRSPPRQLGMTEV